MVPNGHLTCEIHRELSEILLFIMAHIGHMLFELRDPVSDVSSRESLQKEDMKVICGHNQLGNW